MAYESPIRLITELENKIIEHQEEGIYKAVLSYRIDISKDELFQLLYGDRKQYEKGYEDGRRSRDREIVRCKDCAYAVDHDEEYVYCSVHDTGFKLDGFCSEGEPVGEVYNG